MLASQGSVAGREGGRQGPGAQPSSPGLDLALVQPPYPPSGLGTFRGAWPVTLLALEMLPTLAEAGDIGSLTV